MGHENVFGAGCYDNSIGLYDVRQETQMVAMFYPQNEKGESEGSGVTQIAFSSDGQYLFGASRKSDNVMCWDLRNPSHVLHRFARKSTTNQHISFDISPHSPLLVSSSLVCLAESTANS